MGLFRRWFVSRKEYDRKVEQLETALEWVAYYKREEFLRKVRDAGFIIDFEGKKIIIRDKRLRSLKTIYCRLMDIFDSPQTMDYGVPIRMSNPNVFKIVNGWKIGWRLPTPKRKD